MKNIVWVASYPKSGNTWVRALLQVALQGALDLQKLGDTAPNFTKWAARLASGKIKNWGDIRFFWNETQKRLSENAKGGRLILKTHNACGKYDTGPFPNPEYTGAAIYVVRDPRDVAVSYAHHFDVPIEKAIERLLDKQHFIHSESGAIRAEMVMSWDAHVQSWASAPFPVLLVRYEDLLSKPKQVIPELLKFLSIDSKASLDQLIEETSFINLSSKERDEGFDEAVDSTSFFREGRAGQWKEVPGVDFSPLEKGLARTMAELGYGDAPPQSKN